MGAVGAGSPGNQFLQRRVSRLEGEERLRLQGGDGHPGVKGVSQRRDRAEMVASLGAVGQRTRTEQHPTTPYQHRPLSGIFHDVLALPCPRPLHTPPWCQSRERPPSTPSPRSPSPSPASPLRHTGCRRGPRSHCQTLSGLEPGCKTMCLFLLETFLV